MRPWVIISLLVLASCGPKPGDLAGLDALDLEPCGGWTGATPRDDKTLLKAAAAEKFGRLCDESKLQAVHDFREAIQARAAGLSSP
ncbi:hypothetical protein [Thioclava nitratireducens]|uniref:hypothetical protein n=1 Tax=Thioclava nitratireducens TaxID=1915078 RepID=UPI0012FD5336|nr:hypothetical protein [Thioclava nitratireducens]